ncbi:cell division protein FtsQ/DivIB [Bartonella ancashensis]|uniref:Cell division protein FtsQ n=1 Tax=Bartonella ancashensis TaxID=1318743 RepID=A0A0M3T302_9HYPH|nr:cell division protein FtsQ/DivIB [Bartonella ancashensis]ALE03625.1 Cell division protein FtsQ [Bartonella ancashensis]
MYALSVDKARFLVSSGSFFRRLYRRLLGFLFKFVVDINVPRHLGSYAVISIFSISLLYGMEAGGHLRLLVKSIVSNFGFVITHVGLSGNKHMTEGDILRILKLNSRPPIISFDVKEARSSLEKEVWIRSANIQKIYPNQVRIAITEREPYAIWQHDGMIDIIDETGYVIAPLQENLVRNLPLVVGQGAQNAAKSFIQLLSAYPELQGRVGAYIRVGDRRWDVILDNGTRIMLPEKGTFERISHFVKQGVMKDLLSRDVLSIDLRLSDRITVALSDEALAQHHATVAKQERLLKSLKTGSV